MNKISIVNFHFIQPLHTFLNQAKLSKMDFMTSQTIVHVVYEESLMGQANREGFDFVPLIVFLDKCRQSGVVREVTLDNVLEYRASRLL